VERTCDFERNRYPAAREPEYNQVFAVAEDLLQTLTETAAGICPISEDHVSMFFASRGFG
jgi:hypothetical protein